MSVGTMGVKTGHHPVATSWSAARTCAVGYCYDMTISKGDKISWNTPQGSTHGVAQERKVEDFTFDGQQFRASSDAPYWIVKSDKSGKEAAHKESSLEAF